MRDLLVALIVFGSVPMTFVRPYIGILVWYWLSLMNPHRLTWGFAYDLRVAAVVGATTVLAWLLSREPKRPPGSAPVILLALFTIWISICALFAQRPDLAYVKWEQVIKILAMTFVAMCLIQDRHRINLMVWVIAGSIGFYGLRGGVFSILTGGNYRVYGPPLTFIEDNNQLGLALVMVLPLIWYLRNNATKPWIRLGLLGLGGLTVVAVVGTYSRGGFLALCITLFFLWLKSRYRAATAIAAVTVMLGVLAWLPDKWFDRMSSIQNYEEDKSAQGRFDAWTFAFRVAKDHPFMGGGFSVFYDKDLFFHYVPDAAQVRNAHSIYFEVLGENGFVGLGLFLLLGLSCLLTAGAIIRSTRDRPDLAWARSLAAMIQVSLIGYASAGSFLNLGFFDLYYVLIAVIAALREVVKRELAKAQPEAESDSASADAVAIPAAATR